MTRIFVECLPEDLHRQAFLDLPRTIVLDVSKFPAAASRVDISSAIVNRFTAYKVNAVQFVGNLARVTFSSASNRDAVMRFESVRVGDVDWS